MGDKMKKRIVRLLSLILIVIIPFGAFIYVVEDFSDPYTSTYLGAFEDKYERLYDAEEKKIVFIGGSSLPFGLRSDIIQEELQDEYTVINFGLYATLGTKFMMDMSFDAINDGDIVILCPELNEQTYSLYFNSEAVLQANNGLSGKIFKLPFNNRLSLYYNYYKYAFTKIEYNLNNNAPDPIGIYRSDSFNEYGDISVERKNNIMPNGVDTNMPITVGDNLLDEDFIDYVNKYISKLEKKGASVYFNYSPNNRMALRSSMTACKSFETKLSESLNCELLGNIEDYMIDERYFYDTNFHLNSAGAIYFSNQLVLDIKSALDMEEITDIDVPSPPELEEDKVVEVEVTDEKVSFDDYNGEPNNDYLDYFEYELKGSSYTIVGIKSEYLGIEEVILPSVYEGKNITGVAPKAFYGCSELKYIHIGSTYHSLAANAFDGCVALKGIYLYEMDGNKISPPNDSLLAGAPDDIRLYVPEGSNYMSGYTWINYADYFETFSKENINE